MPRSFNLKLGGEGLDRGAGFWLPIVAGSLGLLNLIALGLWLWPPGGSRSDLEAEGARLQQQIASVRSQSSRLRQVAAEVQTGGEQAANFEDKFILPKRTAYERLFAELRRITKASGMQDRDAVYSEEPIEGTADLTLLSSSANYEGTYQNLRRFLLELDHSPVLVMLENLQAAPQQKGNRINASMRFQTILREPAAAAAAERGQP